LHVGLFVSLFLNGDGVHVLKDDGLAPGVLSFNQRPAGGTCQRRQENKHAGSADHEGLPDQKERRPNEVNAGKSRIPIKPNKGLITPTMTKPTPMMTAARTAVSATSRRVRDAGMVNTTMEPMANPTQADTNSHVLTASPMQHSLGNNAHNRQAMQQGA
jgi:hypothetical protein